MKPTGHPPHEVLDRFRAGTLDDRPQLRFVTAHLARRCDRCERYLGAELARELAECAQILGEPGDLLIAGALARTATGNAAVQEERLAAAACWALLRGTAPAAERLRLATADPRFHRLGVAARLLEEVRADDEPVPDPDEAPTPRELFQLALAVLDRLPPGRYPPSQIEDLRARAFMAEAATLAMHGRHAEARGHLKHAAAAQADGSGDALEQAALAVLTADLDREQGQAAAAAAGLRRALATYRRLGERHEAGRVLHKLSQLIGYERPVDGVVTAEQALALIEPGRDLHLDLAARHGLIWFLNDGGMGRQALDLLDASRRLYRQLSDTLPCLLLPWLEARICRRLGEVTAAERGLLMLWSELRWSAYHQEAALVSLDLAEVYLACGKARQAVELLAKVLELLQTWSMHADGLAAWTRVMAQVESGGARPGGRGGEREAAALLRDASLYFRRSWRRAAPFGA